MGLNLHIVMLSLLTLGVGWVMTLAGVQKHALELRRRRVCPSCGREIEARTCRCAHRG